MTYKKGATSMRFVLMFFILNRFVPCKRRSTFHYVFGCDSWNETFLGSGFEKKKKKNPEKEKKRKK
jgi:hypothetical protein